METEKSENAVPEGQPIGQQIIDPKTLPVAGFSISIFHDSGVKFTCYGAEIDLLQLANYALSILTERMQGHVNVSANIVPSQPALKEVPAP